MANPVSSIVACLGLVPDFLVTQSGPVDQGAFAGIPLVASVRHFTNEANGATGYSITFDLSKMKEAAAEAMGVTSADVTVTYTNGDLAFMTTAGGGGGGGNT